MKDRVPWALKRSHDACDGNDMHQENNAQQLSASASVLRDLDRLNNTSHLPSITEGGGAVHVCQITARDGALFDGLLSGIVQMDVDSMSNGGAFMNIRCSVDLEISHTLRSCHGATTTACYTEGYLPNTPFGTSRDDRPYLVLSVENIEEVIEDAMQDYDSTESQACYGDGEYELLDQDQDPDQDPEQTTIGSSRDISDVDNNFYCE